MFAQHHPESPNAGNPFGKVNHDPFTHVRSGPSFIQQQATERRTKTRSGNDVETSLTISLEDAYLGAQRSISFQQTGNDNTPRRKTYGVKIPPGIRDDQVMRLRGQGNSRDHGSAGDILIRIHITTHPRFTLKGDNLEVGLPLSPSEAVLGTTISVSTLDGNMDLKVPPGIQTGKRLRIREKGWKKKKDGKGDLYLKVHIQVPSNPSTQEKDLYERLEKISRFKPRG